MLNILPSDHPHARRRIRKKRHPKRRPWWAWTLVITGTLATLYGIAAAGVFLAVKWHITDEAGRVDTHATEFQELAVELASVDLTLPDVPDKDRALREAELARQQCRLAVVRRAAPRNGVLINSMAARGLSSEVITKMLFAAALRLPSDSPAIEAFRACNDSSEPVSTPQLLGGQSLFPWANAEEWPIVAAAFHKDKKIIDRVSGLTGVPSRLILSVAMVEQLRLYFTQRELFEKFFRPLKVLGNATQFAWGVMAIKEKTAIDIERYANSPTSSFYPGPGIAALLKLPAENPEKVRFERIKKEKDHTYSYLYGAIELKEIMARWQVAGFPIEDRPEILATLFNIGFTRSRPSDHPVVGGSTLTIANTEYTFGGLAFEFYYSGELAEEFPFPAELPAASSE